MKLINSCIALVALFTAYACAAAVPNSVVADITKRAGNATEPTLDPQVLASLSTWFGWQLAGGAKDINEISEACLDLASIGGEKWKQIGLVPANIRQSLCNASHGSPGPDHAFPNSIPAISAIVERQLTGSFTGKNAFAYLCDNLAFFQIDQFFLTDSKLLTAVCGKAGKQVPPRPFGADAGRPIGQSAGFAARNTASILYATLFAAGAESDLQLNVMCAHAPDHIVNLDAEQLNGTLVESTLCDIKTPLQIDEAQSKILSWTSRLYITVLENIGDTPDWLGWLCENLDTEGMNSVGLVGWGSKQSVCDDARSGGPPDELVLPIGIPCNGTNGA